MGVYCVGKGGGWSLIELNLILFDISGGIKEWFEEERERERG